jgi:hypothetical protein
MMFAAEFASISRVWTSMLTSEGRGYARRVEARSIPQDLIVFAESAQDRFMNTPPNAGLHPFAQARPACHAATAAELTRQILSRFFSPENEQDSREGSSIIDARPHVFGGSAVTRKMID